MGSGNTWNSYRYWMMITPYPSGNSDFENPSLLQSSDGSTWTVPAGLTNPIVAKPVTGYNADPDIIIGQDDKMYMVHMDSDGSTQNRALARSSSDGVTWSGETELFVEAYKAFGSPALVWDGSQYVMWYVDGVTSPYKLYKRTSATTPEGTWSAKAQCTIQAPPGYDIWHLDVVLDSGTYYAFVAVCTANTNGQNTVLWLYTSTDGDTFTPVRRLLTPSAGGWDNGKIYRTSAVKTATGFDLWYSAESSLAAWRIGRTIMIGNT